MFQYRLFFMFLDLAELPNLFDIHPLWSYERFNIACFRRRDHFGDPAIPLLDDGVTPDVIAGDDGIAGTDEQILDAREFYDHLVVNDDLEGAIAQVVSILEQPATADGIPRANPGTEDAATTRSSTE